MLIAIEGIDGSGKTTQVAMLSENLSRRGYDVVSSKEPTDGQFGKKLRQSAFTGRLDPTRELELFIEDRKEHVSDLIIPSLSEGKIVILDRYYFSTIAYQSSRGLDAHEIQKKNESFAPKPDILIILSISVDESLRRIGARDGKGNDFEDRANLLKCKAVFDQFNGEDIFQVDAQRSKEIIAEEIAAIAIDVLQCNR